MFGSGRKFTLTRALVWLLVLLVPAEPPVHAAEQSPQLLVRSVTASVLDTLRARGGEIGKDQGKLVALIEDQVVPYFDFRLMSVQVLGRYWRTAGEEQREQFTSVFKQLLTNTYAAVFERYEGQTVDVLGAQSTSNANRVLVPTIVNSPGKPAIEVAYRLYYGNGKWQIYDVVVDGISLLINYRSEYASALSQNSLDNLIDKLKAKNAAFKRAPD